MKIIVKANRMLNEEQLRKIKDDVKKVLNGESEIIAIRDDINITVLNRKNKLIIEL